jgi:hypothetical protein
MYLLHLQIRFSDRGQRLIKQHEEAGKIEKNAFPGAVDKTGW